MSDFHSLYSVLKQTADPQVADAIQNLVETGADHELNRINLVDFSAKRGLDEERVISGFLHASRLGIFDLSCRFYGMSCPTSPQEATPPRSIPDNPVSMNALLHNSAARLDQARAHLLRVSLRSPLLRRIFIDRALRLLTLFALFQVVALLMPRKSNMLFIIIIKCRDEH